MENCTPSKSAHAQSITACSPFITPNPAWAPRALVPHEALSTFASARNAPIALSLAIFSTAAPAQLVT